MTNKEIDLLRNFVDAASFEDMPIEGLYNTEIFAYGVEVMPSKILKLFKTDTISFKYIYGVNCYLVIKNTTLNIIFERVVENPVNDLILIG